MGHVTFALYICDCILTLALEYMCWRAIRGVLLYSCDEYSTYAEYHA